MGLDMVGPWATHTMNLTMKERGDIHANPLAILLLYG